MNADDTVKRGRGRGRGARGARGKGRGRGRGRGRKAARVVSSDEEVSLDVPDEIADKSMDEIIPEQASISVAIEADAEKENEMDTLSIVPDSVLVEPIIVPQTIDMEADISQLEAPTFTTITRGPPEPMLRLKWDHKVSLIGEKVLNPMIHCCDQCDKPILVYGRMIPCKHVFCLKCARAEPVKLCPRCKDKVVRVEQSGLGTVFMCTHEGSRYGNTGCRRTYLSQRDLQAHINHRHMPPSILSDTGKSIPMQESKVAQRKISESSSSATIAPTAIPPQNRQPIKTAQPSLLTQANLNRLNNPIASMQEVQQSLGKQQTQHESVADASYYSSVLNSYGGSGGSQTYSSPTVALINQNYGQMPSIGQQPSNSPAPMNHSMGQPPPPPVPPVAIPPFYPYGQQFGQIMPPNYHNQFDQNNFQKNQGQWNQQQYYR